MLVAMDGRSAQALLQHAARVPVSVHCLRNPTEIRNVNGCEESLSLNTLGVVKGSRIPRARRSWSMRPRRSNQVQAPPRWEMEASSSRVPSSNVSCGTISNICWTGDDHRKRNRACSWCFVVCAWKAVCTVSSYCDLHLIGDLRLTTSIPYHVFHIVNVSLL